MELIILISMTLAAALVVALVAWLVARRIAASGQELTAGPLLLAIVISLAVLQGAAKLAVAVVWAYARAGIDPQVALGGQLQTVLFAASFVPIAAYVVTFLMTFRNVRGRMP